MTRVLIPWHGGEHPERYAALGWVQFAWRTHFPDWPVTIGALSADSDWCKADAVEVALRSARPHDDDIIVVADADVWVDPGDIQVAVDAVESGSAAWAMPHRLVRRLSESATNAVLSDELSFDRAAAVHGLDREPYVGTVGGGMTILSVENYRDCPIDPRFVGWGQEDESWGDALRTLLGHRWRGAADLWHLWHPPLPRLSNGIGNTHGLHVRSMYRRYVGDESKMRRLIESGREFLIE